MEKGPTGESPSEFKFYRSGKDAKQWELETGEQVVGRKLHLIFQPGVLEHTAELPKLARTLVDNFRRILPDHFRHNIPGHKEDPLRVRVFRSEDGVGIMLTPGNEQSGENAK